MSRWACFVIVPPQLAVTSESLVVSIDVAVHCRVTDPRSAVYGIANYVLGLEQVVTITLRQMLGSMDLGQTLNGRDQISRRVRGALDAAAGPWGIAVHRVELTSIEPWDRERRAVRGALARADP